MNTINIIKALCQDGRILEIGVDIYGNIMTGVKGYDIREGSCCIGAIGRGRTFDESLQDYTTQINGREMRTLDYKSRENEKSFTVVFVD